MRLPTDDELEFGATVRDLLEERGAVATTRGHADDPTAWNRDIWQELAQMGVTDLVVDGEFGALVEVADALGRHPATVPALAGAVLVPALLTALDAPTPTEALAIGPVDAHGFVALADVEVGDDGAVTGRVPLALGAAWAEGILVLAQRGDRVAVVRVALAAADITPRDSLDVTHPFADVTLDHAPGEVLIEVPRDIAETALARAHAVAALWLSAGEVGTAQRLLDLAVAYAADRVQFGMPIGRRQAIKHRCADMLMLVESARSAVWAAAEIEPGGDGWDEAAALLRLATDRAVDAAAQGAFQIHGGIGFTWEHDLHLLFKRAIVSRTLLGGAAHHRDTLTSILAGAS